MVGVRPFPPEEFPSVLVHPPVLTHLGNPTRVRISGDSVCTPDLSGAGGHVVSTFGGSPRRDPSPLFSSSGRTSASRFSRRGVRHTPLLYWERYRSLWTVWTVHPSWWHWPSGLQVHRGPQSLQSRLFPRSPGQSGLVRVGSDGCDGCTRL